MTHFITALKDTYNIVLGTRLRVNLLHETYTNMVILYQDKFITSNNAHAGTNIFITTRL